MDWICLYISLLPEPEVPPIASIQAVNISPSSERPILLPPIYPQTGAPEIYWAHPLCYSIYILYVYSLPLRLITYSYRHLPG